MNNIELKELRKKLNLTQAGMAAKVGVDVKTIQNWEAGRPIPKSKDGILREITNSVNPLCDDMREEQPKTSTSKKTLNENSPIESLSSNISQLVNTIDKMQGTIDKLIAQQDRYLAIIEKSR